MANDEEVNGPRIAADILNRMKGPAKERLVRAVQKANPQVAQKIEENLYNFDEIAELTPQGVQVLVQEVTQGDLVVSLKTASARVRETLLTNMSERKQRMVLGELAALPPTRLSEVEEAQRRILKRLDELRTAGQIRSQSKNDIWV